MAPFAFNDDLRPRPCHACPDPHLIDVISFVSHCPPCEHLVKTYIQCWRPPFTTVVSQWWCATTHVGERRNFVRGLVPMSLYTKLTTPPSGRRKPAHCHDLKLALKACVPLLLNALYRTLEWLNDNPPPAPLTPPAGPNSWGRPWSPYSTPHTALQRPPPRLPPSPPPLGQSGTQASKAPPSPIPCGTRQSSETRPPAPKTCPASIAETQHHEPTSARAPAPQTAAHNPGHVQPPPPPLPASPLVASAPASAPSPRITRYFAPAPPSAASTNSHSSSSSSNVLSL